MAGCLCFQNEDGTKERASALWHKNSCRALSDCQIDSVDDLVDALRVRLVRGKKRSLQNFKVLVVGLSLQLI